MAASERARLSDITRRGLTRRLFLRGLAGLAGTGLGILPGLAYGYRVEPVWLDLVQVRVPLVGLPVAFHGLRIAQISDLHRGPSTSLAYIAEAAELAQSQAADVIVLTGDYVTDHAGYARELIPVLGRLSAPLGVYGVLGNHDHWTDAEEVSSYLLESGILLLNNRAISLHRGSARIWLAGVDDVWEQQDDLPSALSGVPAGDTVILLAHEPDFADTAAEYSVALQLSGHSHGGQVRLPGIGGPVLPKHAHKYPIGLNRAGNAWVYTNRGIGSHPLVVRFNCRPEVTVLTLSGSAPQLDQS